MNNEKVLELTKEQIIFYKKKRKIESLQEEMVLDPSKKETNIEQIKAIKEELFKIIYKYGVKEISRVAGANLEVTNSSSDARQNLALAFFEKFDAYDPLKTAPITFFAPYFRQTISEQVRNETGGSLTQYDTSNLRLIRNAIAYYESIGVKYTMEMIAKKTELSPKVINSTMHYGNITKHAGVEEAEYILSNSSNPEAVLLQNEKVNTLASIIKDYLTEEQWLVFQTRWNPDGSKELSYKEVAERLTASTGKPYSMKLVKSICSKATTILQTQAEVASLGEKKGKIKRTVQADPLDILNCMNY